MPEKTHFGAVRRPDWRNAEDYRHMLDYDATSWAGEWLRRNPEFLADLEADSCLAYTGAVPAEGGVQAVTCMECCLLSRWGVHCCQTSDGQLLFFWLSQHNPQVLVVEAYASDDGFDLRQCPLLMAILRVSKQETHILFGDGARTLQVIVRGAFNPDKPVSFRCVLQGWKEFEAKPVSLRRLCELYRRGRLAKSLFPKEQRAGRWIEMLRTWDGLQSGSKQRDIAATIFGPRAAGEGWENGARTRMQRLVRPAKKLAGGGHMVFLNRTGKKGTDAVLEEVRL